MTENFYTELHITLGCSTHQNLKIGTPLTPEIGVRLHGL